MNDSDRKAVVPQKRRLRWYQFSLRTLLLFVLLVSAGMSWLGNKLYRARRQHEAVVALMKSGATVYYDSRAYGKEATVPEWVQGLLGKDLFFDVHSVSVNEAVDFRDEHAAPLRELTGLRTLYLDGAEITDAGLEHLEGLTRLADLYLRDTQVTGAGLEHLEGLTNLQRLGLGGTRVTPAGLEHLKALTRLQCLSLSMQVAEAGSKHLKALPNLQELDLRDTQVTEAGVKTLQKALPNCTIDH